MAGMGGLGEFDRGTRSANCCDRTRQESAPGATRNGIENDQHIMAINA
jgi:hypothetical protein